MPRNVFLLILLVSSLNLYNTQNKTKKNHHLLISNPLFNITTKNVKVLKFHSKILQTVYSDSFSKNYYYTTLYVGHN